MHVPLQVCHIRKEGKWVIFNDEKVAQSKSPPVDLGYLYFYRNVGKAGEVTAVSN